MVKHLNKRKYVSFLKLLILLFAAICCLYISRLILYKAFQIKVIEITGTNINVSVNEEKIPKILLFFPSEAIRKELLSEYPQLQDIQIEKKLPFTLKITLVQRIPLALIKSGNTGFYIDSNAVIFHTYSDLNINLPLIDINTQDWDDGMKIRDAGVQSAVAFLNQAQGIKVDRIRKIDSETLSVIIGATEVLISNRTEYTYTVSTLQMILSRFRMKGTMPTRIDLRFDKPILSF